MATLTPNTAAEARWFTRQARAPRLRTMRAFAEGLVLPDGPWVGRRFRVERQPYTGHYLDLLDSGLWNRFTAVGPTQSGKTWIAFILPTLYHLFEVEENVICGLPDMDMAADKWNLDLLPAILRSPYRDLLPRRGLGSKGGKVRSLTFRNGCTLRFMSGGGRDKSRAAFTARVLVVTEADGLDTPGSTSRETDKLKQLEGRTRAYGDHKRIYLECTASIEEGRIWQEVHQGTATELRLPCPHCKAHVTPEREHFSGWQEAENEHAARAAGAFHCPACAEPWTEAQRRAANLRAVAVHRGQEVTPDGQVTGHAPPTSTLGFRWSAVHNLFTSAAQIAGEEWAAARAQDEEAADREMRQQVWALPAAPPDVDEAPLDTKILVKRRDHFARGLLPPDTQAVTVGVDLGKRYGHYLVLAGRSCRRLHIPDYGRFDVPSDAFDLQVAISKALGDLVDTLQPGWPQEGRPELRPPDQIWIDESYPADRDAIHGFCHRTGEGLRRLCRPVLGRGVSQRRDPGRYTHPSRTSRSIRRIGNGWHLARLDRPGWTHVVLDVDHGKNWLDARLRTPPDQPGALTFFDSPAGDREHITLTKHLTAERSVTEWKAGLGWVTRWEAAGRANHLLDCLVYAAGALDLAGWRLTAEPEPSTGPPPLSRQPPLPPPAPAEPTATEAAGWFAQQKKSRRRGRR